MQGAHSNLECFLHHTTPTVPCNHQELATDQRAGDGEWMMSDKCAMPFFNMGDLWRSFEEWSAYGAGVPLVLPCGDTIVQYYVPYLSALQIYTVQQSRAFLPKLRETTSDESEWSDTCESRDSSNETTTSSDTETDTVSPPTDLWEMGSSAPPLRLSTSNLKKFDGMQQEEHHHGHLIFEYFENSSPYGRAPLKEKISELGVLCPLLFSLNSHDLSSASWFSVAWYPIYRIPIGPTMEDLSTCFLTYHSLWTPPTLQEGELWCDNLKKSNNVMYGLCNKNTLHVQDDLAWRRRECRRVLELVAFGLASYKLKGLFWTSPGHDDIRRIFSLTTCANSWLRQQRVQHPDFEFFRSRPWEEI